MFCTYVQEMTQAQIAHELGIYRTTISRLLKRGRELDVVALPPETPVIQLAQRLGKKTISGAELIALQAVEQFVMYTGVRPDDTLVAEAAAFARAG